MKNTYVQKIQGELGEGVIQYGNFADKRGRGYFKCGRPHILVQNTSDFLKFMVCPHGQEGRGEPMRTFFGQEGTGQFSAILCGCLLWTAVFREGL